MLSLVDLKPDDTVKVVEIKFGRGSKLYSYICFDDVNTGDIVHLEGKPKPETIINVKELLVKDLPLPLEKMKEATISSMDVYDLIDLETDNPILKYVTCNNKLIGRDEIINNLLISINKIRMRNSVLIGEAGCGKTSIVEAFAEMVKNDYFVLKFSVGDLIAGTKLRGMLEEKISKVFNDVLNFNKNHQKKIILFVDEIHMIVSNAGCMEAVSVHDQLKTFLTDSNLILIGATTPKEYNKSIKTDKALMRRITPLYVDNLSDNFVIKILDEFSNHNVSINILNSILELSKDIPNTTNPDISLEILDRALASKKVLGEEINLDMLNKIVCDIKKCYE